MGIGEVVGVKSCNSTLKEIAEQLGFHYAESGNEMRGTCMKMRKT